MPTLAQAEFVYQSGSPPDLYQFTIVQNSVGAILVRDIQTLMGLSSAPTPRFRSQ